MADLKSVSALAFSLLVHAGLVTNDEIKEANKNGYEGLSELLTEKIKVATNKKEG